ncbi:CAP domain-containing protein [Halorientalis brevis]|uniref:CAP domain-containing protein n=1 Tax=Halorientalis brevis TaxID=1126241 RepID=A0ABD6CIT4_9EURY|nr:CAP domain-containing protein [Halorientalis brevis]
MKVHRLLPVLALVVFVAVAGAHFLSSTDVATAKENSRLNENRTAHIVHELVNEERAEHGLPPLDYDQQLAAIASDHSATMAEADTVTHSRTDGGAASAQVPNGAVQCNGSQAENATAVGRETVAKTKVYTPVNTSRGTEFFNTERELARGIVDKWLQSPQQRERLLHSSWQAEGVGIEIRGDDTVYVTQEFC